MEVSQIEVIIQCSDICETRDPYNKELMYMDKFLVSGQKWINVTTGSVWMLFSVVKADNPDKIKLAWLKIKKGKHELE